MKGLDDFLLSLKRYKSSDRVFNPYRNKHCLGNLRLYLELMLAVKGRRILLVGEAPGYKGCRITGIPFSSGRVFDEVDHPLLNRLKGGIHLSTLESENTAKIVWGYLPDKPVVPLFWNSFPFHPHPLGQSKKNRAPTRGEIEIGIGYLQTLSGLFGPDVIAGVGRSGVRCCELAFPGREVTYIRHPSYGGKSDFVAGMDRLMQ